jgi:cytochrome c
MTKLCNRVTALAAATLFLLGTAFAQVAMGPITGDAEKGATLYYDYGCYGCHGFNGIGRKNIANNASGILFNETIFLTYLRARADQNPVFPTQTMPNYAVESLSDKDAIDIYAYIRTFKDDPPEVDDIPALKATLEAAENSGK